MLELEDPGVGTNILTLQAADPTSANYTMTFPPAQGLENQQLRLDSSGNFQWTFAGTGDVVGPGSSTDESIARFDGTTGRLLQNSGILIDDSNNVTGINNLTAGGFLRSNTSLILQDPDTPANLVTVFRINIYYRILYTYITSR